VAAKHGLKPVVDWGDPELADCFDEVLHQHQLNLSSCSHNAATDFAAGLRRTFVRSVAVGLASKKFAALQADAQKPIKHFYPRFPSHSDPSLSQASALFAAFVFQKDVPEPGSGNAGPPSILTS